MPGMTHRQIGGGHTLGYDNASVDFSWPRPRDSLGGQFGGGAVMEETHDMMIRLGDRVH